MMALVDGKTLCPSRKQERTFRQPVLAAFRDHEGKGVESGRSPLSTVGAGRKSRIWRSHPLNVMVSASEPRLPATGQEGFPTKKIAFFNHKAAAARQRSRSMWPMPLGFTTQVQHLLGCCGDGTTLWPAHPSLARNLSNRQQRRAGWLAIIIWSGLESSRYLACSKHD